MTVAGHGTGASGQQLWWQGGVDDVRTYSGALSDAQVRTIYLEQRTADDPSGCVAHPHPPSRAWRADARHRRHRRRHAGGVARPGSDSPSGHGRRTGTAGSTGDPVGERHRRRAATSGSQARDRREPAVARPRDAVAWPRRGDDSAHAGCERGPRLWLARGRGHAGRPPRARTAAPEPEEAAPRGHRASAIVADVRVKVESRSRAAALGVDGLVLNVSSASDATPIGPVKVKVEVDYSGFAGAAGGDYGSRLSLFTVPTCAMSTPSRPECRTMTPLETANDVQRQEVSATLDLTDGQAAQPAPASPSGREVAKRRSTSTPAGARTVVMAAGPSGGAGSFSATPLAPSSAWGAGGQTGDFTWSYPLRTPPGVAGPEPDLAIGYSSGSVDGRTSATNNQTSWVGEGHDLNPGYVERRYVACADDMTGGSNTVKTGDLCWSTDNATLVFGGRSSDLVKDTATGSWKLKDDDGSRIVRGNRGYNGDNDREYWVLTTTDGTMYFFGYGKRSGSDTGGPTNSAWTVPVFGNQPGEPCAAATFAASHCQQAWRWNLDYVIDPDDDTMTYYYAAETNNYGRNLNSGVSSYTRGGYLTRIDYGERLGTEHTTLAPAHVAFAVAERCLPSGQITCAESQLTSANASHWPDVPFDRICTSATSCPSQVSPTFFTRKRLTQITTYTTTGSTSSAVDAWVLTHQFPDPGDGTAKALWLASIQHSGHVGGNAARIFLPRTEFIAVQMANRVDGLDNAPPLNRMRISAISTEGGSSVAVSYSAKDCTPTSKPASPQSNTRRCFPIYWTAVGESTPTIHYFHKYVVSSVSETDLTGQGPPTQVSYGYVGSPAWHYDESETVPTKYRTYGQWRGYGTVDTHKGGSGQAQTHARTLYFRGMHDDPLPGGAKRVAIVTDSHGGTYEDHARFEGFVRESLTYDGVSGPLVESTLNTPWISTATATNGTVTAHMVDLAATTSYTPLEDGGTRATSLSTSYDAYGSPVEVNDLGDLAVASDDVCTTTTYTRNSSQWIVDTPATSRQVATACGVAPSLPADLISDTRTFYDGATLTTTPPTRGNVTRTDVADSYTTGPVYLTTARAVYDLHGRPVEAYDALDRKTSTAYTPATGGPVTAIATTNAAGHTTTSTVVPAWGVPAATVDANARRTDLAYDSLGRLTSVWLPGRNKATQTANTTFGYVLEAGKIAAVSTSNLRQDGNYNTSWSLFDGMLRPRQTQAPSATGTGRVLTDTTYDTRGFVVDSNGPYYNSASGPTSTLLIVSDGNMPTQTRTTYDGAGRPVSAAFRVEGVEKWRTTTTYGGDRVHTTPPAGGTATTVITDARGRTTQMWQHHGPAPTAAHDTVSYTYTPAGQLSSHTDAAGNTWTYGYDLLGRQTSSDDPDRGTSTSSYDAAGQLTTSTDARGQTVHRSYDLLGRLTTTRDGSGTGPVLTSTTYDTLAKGMATSSTRYEDGNPYTSAVTGYDVQYRPTGTSLTIPAVEGALAGTYTTATTYRIDGAVATHRLPAAPGVPDETLQYFYSSNGVLDGMGGAGSYVGDTLYSPYGDVTQLAMGPTLGKAVWVTNTYELAPADPPSGSWIVRAPPPATPPPPGPTTRPGTSPRPPTRSPPAAATPSATGTTTCAD